MLEEHVFKQSTHNPAYCNVSVSFVHDDYWHDVTPIRTKAKAGRLVLVHRSHLRLLLYYEAAVRQASRALTV